MTLRVRSNFLGWWILPNQLIFFLPTPLRQKEACGLISSLRIIYTYPTRTDPVKGDKENGVNEIYYKKNINKTSDYKEKGVCGENEK